MRSWRIWAGLSAIAAAAACASLEGVNDLQEVACVADCGGDGGGDARSDVTQLGMDAMPGDAADVQRDAAEDAPAEAAPDVVGAPDVADLPPVAALTLTRSGMTVTADATASTDMDSSPIASFTFDFGDGSPKVGPQVGGTATHAYSSPATYTVTVTVTDTAMLSSTKTMQVTLANATGLTYVGRIGSQTSAVVSSSATLPVGGSGVVAGHTIVLALLLSSYTGTAGVSATDSAGNVYTLDPIVNDTIGDELCLLSSVNVLPLATGKTITVKFPTTPELHFTAEELAGVSSASASAGAWASTIPRFSSGALAGATPTALLFGAVGVETGTAPPDWDPGWIALPSLLVLPDYLSVAYRIVTLAGTYAASGTSNVKDAGHKWMAIGKPFH